MTEPTKQPPALTADQIAEITYRAERTWETGEIRRVADRDAWINF